MWITLGILYVFTSPGVMQLVGSQEFEKPEDCFKTAVSVMADKKTPVHMACMPVIKDLTSS
jgi:hypothetical protein